MSSPESGSLVAGISGAKLFIQFYAILTQNVERVTLSKNHVTSVLGFEEFRPTFRNFGTSGNEAP